MAEYIHLPKNYGDSQATRETLIVIKDGKRHHEQKCSFHWHHDHKNVSVDNKSVNVCVRSLDFVFFKNTAFLQWWVFQFINLLARASMNRAKM